MTRRDAASGTRTPRSPDRQFYLGVALTIAAIVVAGFGPTATVRLFHPPSPPPAILYAHAILCAAWVLLFVVQAALVRADRIPWHRRLGVLGMVLGALVPVVGAETALTMTRRQLAHGEPGGESFLIVSLFDMLAFSVTCGLAMRWRRRQAYHRRLLLLASSALTAPAFARLPAWLMPHDAWYVGVDLLIVAGIARDWFVSQRVHAVYQRGLPLLLLGQVVTMWIYRSEATPWLAIARWLLR